MYPGLLLLLSYLALTPKNIKDFLIPILNWAVRLKELHAAKKFKESPVVTVSALCNNVYYLYVYTVACI